MKNLAIFDFDGTLFRSPERPAWLKEKGWWGQPMSLNPPCVPEKPGSDWWVSATVEAAKKCIADPDTYTVLATGRLHNKFHTRLHALLTQAGLRFDEVHMLPGGSTLPFKLKVITTLLAKLPVERVEVWEDRSEHIGAFKAVIDQSGKESEIHLVSTKSHELECPEETQAERVVARFVASLHFAR